MISGVDFTERFSPVATDASLRIQICMCLKFSDDGWIMRSCDIEGAFLEAEMDVQMCIEPHPAMVLCGFMTEEQRKKTAIQLIKSMCGNVDAAMKFFKLLSEHLTQENVMNVTQSKTDPCVFYKLNDDNKLILILSVAVDDCAISGNKNDIEWFMDEVSKRFNITRDGIISKHLGINCEWGKTNEGLKF